jgi:hypothetical protein
MSDVELFYETARKKFPGAVPWNHLDPFQQMTVIQAINMILGVMTNEG